MREQMKRAIVLVAGAALALATAGSVLRPTPR
jgi:hypothetical protein